MTTFTLHLVLLKATLFAFTGFGSLPQVRQDLVVSTATISDQALNRAVLIGRTTPGPIGLYVLCIGDEVAGPRGALMGWLALITPALLVMPIYGVAAAAMRHRRARGALETLILASAVLIVITSAPLVTDVIARWTRVLGLD